MSTPPKQKIILRNYDVLGDNIMMTGIPRDIHAEFPSQYLIDVRPAKPEYRDLWLYNPHITPIADDDPDARHIQSAYRYDYMNERPDHILNTLYTEVSYRLGRMLPPHKFHGDLHFSQEELDRPSFTEALTGKHIPYWVFGSGSRSPENQLGAEHNVKVWNPERFEEVIEHFKGRIVFVQIGGAEASHRPIRGAINLVNKTDLRSLMHVMAHADGVLCTVTSYMHLSAAIPFRKKSHYRPGVVLVGGREPATWTAYPSNQALHTIGALTCCAHGGCNRWRVKSTGGDTWFDKALCVQPVGLIPRCMEMISTQDVISAIDKYYRGGVLSYLTPEESRLSQLLEFS